MTVGVDTQTSKLVVSASDALFKQVELMVKELDLAAKEARRGVQVVNVSEADSAVLQQALTALLPTVSVGTTTASTSNNNNNPGPPQFGGGSSDDAARRAAFFQQMRELSLRRRQFAERLQRPRQLQ